jgi:hypothetical protein
MQTSKPIEKLPIRNESDVVVVRQVVRKWAMDLKSIRLAWKREGMVL